MRLIANVYHNPPVSRSFPASPPGYNLQFRGGHARVYDERTLQWCMSKAECSISLESAYIGHISRWVADMQQRVQPIRAQIVDPSGSIILPEEYTTPGWMAPETRALFHEAQLREEDEAAGRAEAVPATGAIVWGSQSSA